MNHRRVLTDFAIASFLAVLIATPAVYATSKANTNTQSSAHNATPALKDAWLDGKLEATFLFNDYLNSSDIDSDVKGGVAYLTGTVESDLDRALAGDIAKSIKGIDRVDNKLAVDKVKVQEKSDSAAAKERESYVDFRDGLVTLSGDVTTAQEGELALEIARNTDGARAVTNNLRVGD